jgi:uncharacterized membrane protein YccC
MDAEQVFNIAVGFVIAWGIVSLLHALWMGRDRSWDPAPPEEPHHH